MTPLPIANRPGLPALTYRVGTYASFMATMKARLSTYLPEGWRDLPPLAALTTRDAHDAAIAMLDAWALIADVLSFYQERIANEGFLRTATESLSIRSLASLVGYAWRPGVAASVHLAYGVQDPGGDAIVTIPAGHRVQSTPEAGALPQTFEIAQALTARASWNRLTPRATRPQQPAKSNPALYFKGIATNLKPNDPLLFVANAKAIDGDIARVATVEPQFKENRTKVTLVGTEQDVVAPEVGNSPLSDPKLLERLAAPPASYPRTAADLGQDVSTSLDPGADAAPQLLSHFKPALRSNVYAAMGNATVTTPSTVEVHAFRLHTAPFGHAAPLEPVLDDKGLLVARREWTLSKPRPGTETPETFKLALNAVPIDRNPFLLLRLDVTVGRESFSGDNSGDPTHKQIHASRGNERVTLTITTDTSTGIGNRPVLVNLLFELETRRIEIDLAISSDNTGISGSKACDEVALIWTRGLHSFFLESHSPEIETSLLTIEGIARFPQIELVPTETANVIDLDQPDDKLVPGGWVVIERSDMLASPIVAPVDAVSNRSRTDYGLSNRTTSVTLGNKKSWLGPEVNKSKTPVLDEDFATVIRGTNVFAESERLELADVPIEDPLDGGDLQLDGIYGGLEPGRWLIVEGERVDIPHTSGIRGAEVVMLAGSEHGVASGAPPGETMRTTLKLASPLAYRYAAGSVAIYGNVAPATGGETRSEVLGGGDASVASAQFALRQSPLTYVSAVTPSGVESTLQVRVNDVLWREVERLDELGPGDRNYVLRHGADGKPRIEFGNGIHGARLPSGVDNVQAAYRTGIGSGGNVPAGKVNQLVMRPSGVVSVANPVPASGGADSEGDDQARSNAPLAVMALDRLVSVQDYADFARTFAGVGKASAARIAVGHRQTVCLTIGATDESPLDADSDLCRNLAAAVRRFGDPHQPVLVMPGEAVLAVLVAKVRVDPYHHWANIEAAVRAALLDKFGFARRDFGQDLVLSEVLSAMQRVPGVDYVDVDRMDSITGTSLMADLERISSRKPPKPRPESRLRAEFARLAGSGSRRSLKPAQIVYLNASVASLVTLTELKT